MSIKTSFQGLLIYLAMALYLAALVMSILRRQRACQRLFLAGCISTMLAIIYRWAHTGHPPMQNLFEVFLWLGLLAYPASLASDRILGLSSVRADICIGILALIPAGLVFSDQPQALPAALQSPLFIPHVAMYMISYMFMAKAGYWAIIQLTSRPGQVQTTADRATYMTICAGLPFMTAGLLLGSIWGHYAWGDWWGWDPKEMWSLACWSVFLLYLHVRSGTGVRYPRLNPILALTGLAFIVITLLWVNLSRLFAGLHSYAV